MPTATRPARITARQQSQEARILRLYCAGRDQLAIAASLGITQGRVSQVITGINQRWQAAQDAAEERFSEEKARHIDRLESLYFEAMEAWERSRKPAEDTSTETAQDTPADTSTSAAPVRRKSRKRQRQRDGDPRFLSQANDCLDKLAKIKGLYASEVRKGLDQRAEQQREYVKRALSGEHTRELLAQLTDAMGGLVGKAAAGGALGATLGQSLAPAAAPMPSLLDATSPPMPDSPA